MKDLNDQHKDGSLPADPGEGATPMAIEVPRVLTVADITRDSYQRALTQKLTPNCVTGHFEIDRATGGLKPGFVWVFGADTSWGKSSWIVMIADVNIRAGRRVLIVSSEDAKEIYGDRLLLRRSKVSADRLRTRTLTPDDRAQLDRVTNEAEDVPVYFDARGRSVEWVALRTRELIKEHRIDVVAFDYLQAFDSDKRHQDRRNQVSYIARALTDVTKTSNIAGILCSQITIQEGKSHPDKHSIRESRDVSNAAEVVALGFTPEKPIKRKDGDTIIVAAGQKCVTLDKVKDGPRGGLYAMSWDDESASFNSVIRAPREADSTDYRYDNEHDSYQETGST